MAAVNATDSSGVVFSTFEVFKDLQTTLTVGDTTNTGSSLSFDVDLKTYSIIGLVGYLAENTNDGTEVRIEDSSGTVLASKSTGNGDFSEGDPSVQVELGISDYSRIPGAETVTVVVESSNLNNSKYYNIDSPSVSNRLFSVTSGQTLYPGTDSNTSDYDAVHVEQVSNADVTTV